MRFQPLQTSTACGMQSILKQEQGGGHPTASASVRLGLQLQTGKMPWIYPYTVQQFEFGAEVRIWEERRAGNYWLSSKKNKNASQIGARRTWDGKYYLTETGTSH